MNKWMILTAILYMACAILASENLQNDSTTTTSIFNISIQTVEDTTVTNDAKADTDSEKVKSGIATTTSDVKLSFEDNVAVQDVDHTTVSDVLHTNKDEERPPSIIVPRTPETVIVESKKKRNFIIKCNATGFPTPTFKWFRNGAKLTDSGTYIKAYVDGTLLFPDFSDRENGWYQCKATNQFGTSVSNIFFLVMETVNLKVEPNNAKTVVRKWEPFSVPCSGIPVTYPKVKIRWFNSEQDQILMDKRIGQDEEGTLHIAHVLEEDDKNLYRCALLNAQTTTIWVAQMGHLIVTEKDRQFSSDMPPTIQYSTKYVEAILGRQIILECFFAGIPLADITWKNSSNHEVKGKQNPRFEVYDYGRKLKVLYVTVNDEGTFSCKGTNDFDSVEEKITVKVRSPPRIDPNNGGGALFSATVPDGTDQTLKCKLHAAPFDTVNTPIWWRNGELLARHTVPDTDRYKFNEDMTALTIYQLDKEKDTACYQCNVTNSVGFMYSDAYFRVINSIKITRQPDRVFQIEGDEDLDFTISATGDKCCKINTLWYFNGSQIDVNQPPFLFNTSTRSLYFKTGSVTMETLNTMLGTYTCRVSNLYQYINVYVQIRFKEEEISTPQPITAAKATIGLWWIGLVCGLLAIAIAVVITLIVVYKRKNPGDTYKLESQELKHNLNPQQDLLNQSFQEI